MHKVVAAVIVSSFSLCFASAALAEPPAQASFPLPSPDGKSIATTPGQRVFHLPIRFARVERFYRERFGGDKAVSLRMERVEEAKSLTIVSQRKSDTWAKAVVREGAVDTVVEVTEVVRLGGDVVVGQAKPLVQIVLPVSPEPLHMANSIDHMSDLRR